jgi:hypothetical protein
VITIELIKKGEALAAAVEAEHHAYNFHGGPFNRCCLATCEATRAWRAARERKR